MKRWMRSGATIARWGLFVLLPALSGGCPLGGDRGRVILQQVVSGGLSTLVNTTITNALAMPTTGP